MQKPQSKAAVEQQLTSALKMVIDGFTDLGFSETHVFGLVNLIYQGFIDIEGAFTPEYVALAKQSIDQRSTKEFQQSLIIPEETSAVSLILPKGIGGR